MQGIYTHIPETNYVPREYSVAAILLLLFMVLISLVSVLNLLHFYYYYYYYYYYYHYYHVPLSRNLETLTSWDLVGTSRLVTGLLYNSRHFALNISLCS